MELKEQNKLEAIIRGRTDNVSNTLADREFSAGCYTCLQFPIQVYFPATVGLRREWVFLISLSLFNRKGTSREP